MFQRSFRQKPRQRGDSPKRYHRILIESSFLFPKDDENTCFIRASDINCCVLFELCLTVVRLDGSENEPVEISCGWTIFPLFSNEGVPAEIKSYELKLSGGVPLEPNVPLPFLLETKCILI
jgi:hypothetical protein